MMNDDASRLLPYVRSTINLVVCISASDARDLVFGYDEVSINVASRYKFRFFF